MKFKANCYTCNYISCKFSAWFLTKLEHVIMGDYDIIISHILHISDLICTTILFKILSMNYVVHLIGESYWVSISKFLKYSENTTSSTDLRSIDLIWDQRIQTLVSYEIIKSFGKSFQKLDMFKSHKLHEKVLLSVTLKKKTFGLYSFHFRKIG